MANKKHKPSQSAIAVYKRHHRKHGDIDNRTGTCLLSVCAVHYPDMFLKHFPRHFAKPRKP